MGDSPSQIRLNLGLREEMWEQADILAEVALPCWRFNESDLWADLVSNSQCPSVMCQLCACVCVCEPSQKPTFLVDWRLLVKECIAYIGIPLDIFECLSFQ